MTSIIDFPVIKVIVYKKTTRALVIKLKAIITPPQPLLLTSIEKDKFAYKYKM